MKGFAPRTGQRGFREALAVMVVLGAIGATALVWSCRTATQITLELTTDIPCQDLANLEMAARLTSVGSGAGWSRTNLWGRAKETCAPVGGGAPGYRLGTMALLPETDPSDVVDVEVLLEATEPGQRCRGAEGRRCVVVRRRLAFQEHQARTVPVSLCRNCSEANPEDNPQSPWNRDGGGPDGGELPKGDGGFLRDGGTDAFGGNGNPDGGPHDGDMDGAAAMDGGFSKNNLLVYWDFALPPCSEADASLLMQSPKDGGSPSCEAFNVNAQSDSGADIKRATYGKFPGDGGVKVVSNALDKAQVLSMAAWVHPSSIPSEDRVILDVDGRMAFIVGPSSPRPLVFCNYRGGKFGPTEIALNTWSHLACTVEPPLDGSTTTLVRFFVDGLEVYNIPHSPWSPGLSSLCLGTDCPDRNTQFFNGYMDSVLLFDRRLTATEVATLKDKAHGPLTTW